MMFCKVASRGLSCWHAVMCSRLTRSCVHVADLRLCREPSQDFWTAIAPLGVESGVRAVQRSF